VDGVRFCILLARAFFSVAFSFALFGEKVRVASFNLQNYLIMDRVVDGKWRKNYPKPEKEKRALRSILKQVDADVVAFQEIGERPFLNELWMDLNVTRGPVYPHAIWMPAGDAEEVRHLALFSKIPFSATKMHHDIEFPYFGGRKTPDRGVLEVTFDSNGTKWKLINLHLKSKWTERKDDPEANVRREKEARAIRDYLRKSNPPGSNPRYLVVGDFNDHRNSATLRRFLQVNDTVLTSMVPCEDSRGHRWTHHWSKADSYSRFDYILATPPMLKKMVIDSAKIVDGPNSVLASDHRMIFADFQF
jgi:endonuclease/exonuclease/phosphatase family metal-dependent hydrolase